MITHLPDTESNPNPNAPTKQCTVVSTRLNSPTYSEKFTRDNVVAPFLLFFVVIISQPLEFISGLT